VQAEPQAAPPASVIHDIGYRHYEGQRLGRGAILRALFVQNLRATYGLGRTAKSKVMPFALLTVMILPALIVEIVLIVLRSQPELGAQVNDQLLPYTRYAVVTQAAIAIYLAAQAPVLFSRDLRFRTVTLYFSRPLTRLDYVIAKYLALAASLLILMTAPLLVMYGGGLLAKLPAGDQTVDLLKGLAGVVLFAFVFAGIGGLIASLTARRGFGVAAIITVFTVSYGGVSTISGIAQAFDNTTLAGYLNVFSPVTLVDSVQHILFDAPFSGVQAPPDGPLAAVVFLLATAALIAGCFGLLVLRYRKVAAA
jgi:ABC-2 type transport system permease protein